MPWKPSRRGERPTLGWAALDWIAENLIVPDGPAKDEPLELTREQAEFVLKLYEVDPKFRGPAIKGRSLTNGRLIRRAVLSRCKGWGKSPLVAGICLLEAFGDVVLDGWDANGQPVGRPWHQFGFKPKVQIVAVSEDQTDNTWEPCTYMAKESPLFDNYDLEVLGTFITGADGVLIEPVTSSGTSREGYRPVFSALDQTESWTKTNGGIRLAATIRRNLGKVNGCSVETPNAFEPGAGSVAEASFNAFGHQVEGKPRVKGILFDHREAPPETDPEDEKSLRTGLAFALGESADVNGGWMSIDRRLSEYWDPDTDPQDARRFYLNQITHATDSWLSQPQWRARWDQDHPIEPRDVVVLGFDGSRKRTKALADATALIGCRVSDGKLFEIAVWEDDGTPGWEVPLLRVETEIADAFKKWKVVGFYADPSMWESHIAAWEAKYGRRLKVKMSRDHPIEWWFSDGRIVQALDQFHTAVLNGEVRHDGGAVLTRHVLNARRRASKRGTQIAKEFPESPRKIDAAVAAVLAWQARLDAVAAGLGKPKTTAGTKSRVLVLS